MSSGPDPGIEVVVQRGFYVGLAVLMAAFAVAGFWSTYWGPLISGTLDLHWLLHLHGVVQTTWLLLLITQAGLVLRGLSVPAVPDGCMGGDHDPDGRVDQRGPVAHSLKTGALPLSVLARRPSCFAACSG